MSKLIFPSNRYHKEHGSKVIESQEEHDEHEADGWVQSPADFDKAEEPIDPDDNSGDDDLSKKSAKELKTILTEMGCPEEETKGKSKADLIKMIEG